jgi:hypothetical protein
MQKNPNTFHIIMLRDALTPGTRAWVDQKRTILTLDKNVPFPQASLVTRGSFLVMNALHTEVRARPHLPKGVDFIFMSNSELDRMTRSEFIRRFPDNLSFGRFSISEPGFNFSKTEAILYVDHSCAGLCGGSAYVLVRKVDGVWRIVDEHDLWMS